MMSTEDEIEQALIKDDHEERIGMLETRIEAMVEALRIQVTKCEKLEEEISSLQEEISSLQEEISSLQEEISSLPSEHDIDKVKEDFDSLWHKHYKLVSRVDWLED